MTNGGTAVPEDALRRLPEALRTPVARLMTQWPGRVVLGSAAGMARVEIFDRAMTIAAQLFTSVFPILIMAAAWLDERESTQLAQALDVPPQTRAVLRDVLRETSFDTFGLVGALVVLVSATSLSRALSRAFCSIWGVARGPRRLSDSWRWVAVVLSLSLSLVLLRLAVDLARELPPRRLWDTAVYFTVYALLAVYLPWLLLAGSIRARHLVPGGIIFAAMMLAVRPASAVYLSLALRNSAERYGPIGVAFTYLTWLYLISFTLLLSAVIGQTLTSDDGRIGRFIRHGRSPAGRP